MLNRYCTAILIPSTRPDHEGKEEMVDLEYHADGFNPSLSIHSWQVI